MVNVDRNIEKKKQDKLRPSKSDPIFVGLNSLKLNSIVKSHVRTKRKHKIISPQTRNFTFPGPKNGEGFTLREAFYILGGKSS